MPEQKNKTKEKQTQKKTNNYIKYSGIATQMIVVIVAGVFGGRKLDELVKWEFPVFTVCLSLFSVFLAMYLALKDFIKPK
jgi:F0F1-type ATP synthase assembly protein I